MTTIFVAGATGNLGSAIVEKLLEAGAQVRALVRSGNADGGARLRHLTDHPALELVVGDLSDEDQLTTALQGVDVVVSAVQGGEKVVIDGQTTLLRAAERAGVPRYLPSDFSLDLHRLDYGGNEFLDLRKKFDEEFETSSVRPTYVLNGGFMEIVLAPFFGIVDLEADTFTSWGNDHQPMDLTTIPDTAAYTAAAALDDSAVDRKIGIAGEVITMAELHTVVEKATGHTLTKRNLGDIAALDAEIERRKPTAEDPFEYVSLQYQRAMVTGDGKLLDLRNADYPHITPTSVAEFLATTDIYDDAGR